MGKKSKKAWPTKAAMEQVYEKNLWGGKDDFKFYSGVGSHHPEIVVPYISALISFFESFTIPPIICDLGCGDFNVGKELVAHTQKYIAVDIVSDLILFNKKKFTQEHLEFQCLDIAKDILPKADCAILRQVLQHLSNSEIEKIVSKLYDYEYVIITEHVPKGDYIPNRDIISGQGIRLKKQSGIQLSLPPFNFNHREEKELLSVNSTDGKGVIVTTLYQVK